MNKTYTLLAGLLLLFTSLTAPAQRLNNDGFHRRNGQMYVLRNGQLRPMTRDARLPTGSVVTKDGFLVTANGQRTELREGQACDTRGRVVAVTAGPAGSFALGSARRAGRRPAEEVQDVLNVLLGDARDDDDRYDDHPGRGNKWKKRKKNKHWDD